MSRACCKTFAFIFLGIIFVVPLFQGIWEKAVEGESVRALAVFRKIPSEANLRTLARWFLYAAPGMRTNLDREELLATGQAALSEVSEHQLHELTHWLINLVHFGKEEAPPKGPSSP